MYITMIIIKLTKEVKQGWTQDKLTHESWFSDDPTISAHKWLESRILLTEKDKPMVELTNRHIDLSGCVRGTNKKISRRETEKALKERRKGNLIVNRKGKPDVRPWFLIHNTIFQGKAWRKTPVSHTLNNLPFPLGKEENEILFFTPFCIPVFHVFIKLYSFLTCSQNATILFLLFLSFNDMIQANISSFLF